MERRDFLKSVTAAGIAAATTGPANAQQPGRSDHDSTNESRSHSPDMIYRELGTTGQQVSAIGFGGAHLNKGDAPAPEMIALLRSAIDRGITFLDNCWDYGGGLCEVRMGQALKGGYRKKVFLMTKIDGRTAKEYNAQLEQSMGRLDTDVIDLVQFHEVIRMEDPDRIFAEGGALQAAIAARQAGKIRYIGFTGHKDPAVHLRMFEVAAQHNFKFDTVQMPVNVMDAHFRSFARQVIPVAQKAGTGVLAMKTFGDDFILKSNTFQAPEALHYGLSQPVSVVITGIDKPAILDQAFNVTRSFKPMSEQEQASLLARTRDVALTGKTELFKTTSHFDGTAQNPKWLG